MDEAKADGKSELPVWVSESRQLRTLLNDAEKSMNKGRPDSNSSQRKFSSLMKADPKEAERLDFRYQLLFHSSKYTHLYSNCCPKALLSISKFGRALCTNLTSISCDDTNLLVIPTRWFVSIKNE